MNTLADKIISFNEHVSFPGKLPPGIRIMNPFKENESAAKASGDFYKKYYSDQHKRFLILGINPGRFGAGITGVPFTDPKRLVSECGIRFNGIQAHEPSSVFVYEMINAYGGPKKFYRNFYINSVFPLGFTSLNSKGKEVNYNYYDSKELIDSTYEFIVDHIRTQISLGMETSVAFCFGTGKNEKFLRTLNGEFHFFDNIIPLEHPRFIMQYRSKTKQAYIDKYLQAFAGITGS